MTEIAAKSIVCTQSETCEDLVFETEVAVVGAVDLRGNAADVRQGTLAMHTEAFLTCRGQGGLHMLLMSPLPP